MRCWRAPSGPEAVALSAVLLAAGEGRRLGQPKAALELAGVWMLPRLVAALHRSGATQVVLVLSAAARRAIAGRGDPGADATVLNPDPARGRTGSILAGLEAVPAEAEGVLIHPCDVPLFSGQAGARLVAAWRACPSAASLVARPVTPAGRGGHPLLVGSERLDTLRSFAADRPLRDLVREDPARLLNVTLTGDPGPFLDVDTPEQRQLLESLLESSAHRPADPHHSGGD